MPDLVQQPTVERVNPQRSPGVSVRERGYDLRSIDLGKHVEGLNTRNDKVLRCKTVPIDPRYWSSAKLLVQFGSSYGPNAYVTGGYSDNAFKITPDGVTTQIIDSTGDGMGNTLDWARSTAVDNLGNAYITGFHSHNAFKIKLCDTLNHYSEFEVCLTGPGLLADPTCACFDEDGDVDLADFARFQQTFVGP